MLQRFKCILLIQLYLGTLLRYSVNAFVIQENHAHIRSFALRLGLRYDWYWSITPNILFY